MKKFVVTFTLALFALMAMGQIDANAQTKSISLKLVDASNDEALPFATISLTPKGSTKSVKYVLTDVSGMAKLEKVSKGTYLLKAELLGYKPHSQELTVADKDINLEVVKLHIDSQVLDAASVSAVGNPITVKKDTIEYNASSFKTTDNDMLVNLLKKLPGVEVDSDGKIKANGEEIKKITIDGKTFFLDDPSLASKNIPAKIVEKVKVVEKKSDQAMFTGIDDGEEETIIDLSIKRGMMNGWFGNVQAGGGHDIQTVGLGQPARWQGAAMLANFTEKSQLSVILNANNTNNRGFNDLAGSMMGAMRGGGGGMGRGAAMWGGNNGILTSWMAGVNGAWTLFDGDMDLAGNYLYNGTDNMVKESSYKETYMDDGSELLYNSDGYSNTINQGHRFGIRLEHKFSDKTSIMFEPQFNFGNGTYDEYATTSTDNRSAADEIRMINSGFNSTSGANTNWKANGSLLFRQKIGEKAGRTFSTMLRYSYSDNKLLGFNQSLTRVAGMGDEFDQSLVNQKVDNRSTSASINARVVYTEPLAEKLFLEASYAYGWSRNDQEKRTFDSAGNNFYNNANGDQMLLYDANGELLNDIYSNDIVNLSQSHRAGLTLQYQSKKLRAQIGAQFQPTITDNITNGDKYNSVKFNWSPQAMLRYEFAENCDVRINYRGRSSQPSTSQLIPVPDNADPLSIRFGNPYLTPYFNHNIRSRFGYTNRKTFFSLHGFLSGSIIQDGISNAQWYDASGVRYSMPMNGPLSGNANMGYFLNAPIAKSNFSISNFGFVNFASSSSYMGKTGKSDELTRRYYDSENANFDYAAFNRDFLMASHSEDINEWFTNNRVSSLGVSETLKFTYRNDFVETSLSGRANMNKPWYTVSTASERITWSNNVQAEMLWTIPAGFGLNADCSYNWYHGYVTEQKPLCLLNAEITKLLFKKMFTLSVKCFDILNQSKTLNITDTDGYHSEVMNNTLGRYVMVSLTYRFGNFGKAGQMMEKGRKGPGGPGGPRF